MVHYNLIQAVSGFYTVMYKALIQSCHTNLNTHNIHRHLYEGAHTQTHAHTQTRLRRF